MAINTAITAAGGESLPEYPDMEPNRFCEDIKETIIWNPYTIEIAINVNRNWNTAVTWRPRDPLAIDLDSDGIETVGLTPTPILFDHNADGIRTGTGWLKGDDAWLTLDRDGNGSIDSGRELFGVDTQITDSNGQTRNATSGFEALRSLDTNADGVFNASRRRLHPSCACGKTSTRTASASPMSSPRWPTKASRPSRWRQHDHRRSRQRQLRHRHRHCHAQRRQHHRRRQRVRQRPNRPATSISPTTPSIASSPIRSR